MIRLRGIALVAIPVFLLSCVTSTKPPVAVEAPTTAAQQVQAQKLDEIPALHKYKRKIAIGRFTNTSNYGRALLSDTDYNAFGKQASDMLSSKLVLSKRFIVFERSDLASVQDEQKVSNSGNLIGVDTLIFGSLTEFGRSTEGEVGFLSAKKTQIARAKVDLRLVEVSSGLAFFSATGSGEAKMESTEVAGFGSYADYNATLNDRAISAAVSDVVDKLVSVLDDRPWRTDILQVKGNQVIITGGKSQGIHPGDVFEVMQIGETIKSKQSGFGVTLPPTRVATITVKTLFGDTENEEGSICLSSDDKVNSLPIEKLFVQELQNESK